MPGTILKNRYFLWFSGAFMLLLAVILLLLWMEAETAGYYTLAWVIAVLLLLVIGNSFITRQLDRYFPWLKFGKTRLFTHLLIGIIYSLIVINLAYFTFKVLFTEELPTHEQYIVMNAYGLVLFIPTFSIYFSLNFLRHWQQSELESERFRKEHLKSQLSALKNHLDPHFLFNNLNILSALIDKDKNLSKAFLDKFAEVYRALLRSKDEDLITLEEELSFLEAYIYLLRTRFEDNISFTVKVDTAYYQYMLPPLTMQMLIENAIKHNIVSEGKPLQIRIGTEANNLVVSNTLYTKPDSLKDVGGSGLENIRSRYAYFTNRGVEVDEAEKVFTVRVPLLDIETV